jgi:hypothetical protein
MSSEHKTYQAAREEAEKRVKQYGIAHGIEKPTPYQGWTVKMLPLPQNRSGWELRCEAVEPGSF